MFLGSIVERGLQSIEERHEEAVEAAMEEMNVMPQQKMDAVKMVAMFKAANIKSKSKRRALLRHLRHHVGKHSFAVNLAMPSFRLFFTLTYFTSIYPSHFLDVQD